ncbi:MAG: TlyA family RNA methyltransferase [Alphaproteobacteria bacterium]|nr:TlyA family RNA methyltransferase [Alphaproteobacteria bacterium]
MRLDVYLHENGYARSRSRAQEMVKSGLVKLSGKTAKKASINVEPYDVTVEEDHPYVSRAALKLKKALDTWKISVEGKAVLDMGASTGGFTQVLCENGAEKVYAVDVGTDQLAEEVKALPQVVDMPQMDGRDLAASIFDPMPTFMVSDLSFISCTKVLPFAFEELPSIEEVICLVKPQFELSPQAISKGGLVKNEALHEEAITSVKAMFEKEGFTVKELMDSPVLGGDGNKEFLLWAKK